MQSIAISRCESSCANAERSKSQPKLPPPAARSLRPRLLTPQIANQIRQSQFDTGSICRGDISDDVIDQIARQGGNQRLYPCRFRKPALGPVLQKQALILLGLARKWKQHGIAEA